MAISCNEICKALSVTVRLLYCLVLFSLISYSNFDGNLYILHYVAAKKFVSRKHATAVKHPGNPGPRTTREPHTWILLRLLHLILKKKTKKKQVLNSTGRSMNK